MISLGSTPEKKCIAGGTFHPTQCSMPPCYVQEVGRVPPLRRHFAAIQQQIATPRVLLPAVQKVPIPVNNIVQVVPTGRDISPSHFLRQKQYYSPTDAWVVEETDEKASLGDPEHAAKRRCEALRYG